MTPTRVTPFLETPSEPLRDRTSYATEGHRLLESMSALLHRFEDTLLAAESDREALRHRTREQDNVIRQLQRKVEKLEIEVTVVRGKSV